MKRHVNSLFFKIACTVIAGVMCLAVALTVTNIMISKKIFVDNFAESQQKIFNQIDNEFYNFYRDITTIMTTLERSDLVNNYLYGDITEQERMKISYQLGEQMKNSRLSEYSDLSVFLIGENLKSYIINSSDRFSVPKKEIVENSIARKAEEYQGEIICQYLENGFTWVTDKQPAVVFAKSWPSTQNSEDTYAFITIKEANIRKMYSSFTVPSNDIVLLNQDNEVISSDNPDYLKGENSASFARIAKEMEDSDVYKTEKNTDGKICTYLVQQLQSTHYNILGIINSDEAFQDQYDFWELTVMTIAMAAIIVLLIFLFVRQQTKPLSELVQTMQNSRKMKYKEHVQVKGTDEVRKLSETYNDMVDELDSYIHSLIQVEKDKRAAEIHTLQMQINPHYIYNTLASIKWLIWQGDTQKTTGVIDAFIALLRNTISNTDEFVTVEQEIQNLKNYVLINQARYGDSVSAEFYVTPQCSSYRVPKLILQPFVENAFFHGFADGRRGKIQVFVKEEGDCLRFEIRDDGIGIKTERLMELKNGNASKTEHFTGIGVGNVDQRIKLIYGEDYGIHISSEEGKGTTVTLTLKKKI